MIVACSNCLKRFNIEDSLIPPQGRLVQCSMCSCTWKQLPEKPIAVNTSSADAPPTTSPIPSIAPQTQSKWTAFLLFFALGTFLLAFLILGRNTLIELYPEAENAYTFIGFPTQNLTAGLMISNLTPLTTVQNGLELLVVTGQIKNLSPFPRELSSLLFNVMSTPDSQGGRKVLESWEHALPPTILNPGATLALKTYPRINPPGSNSVTVEFYYDPLNF